VDTVGEIPPFLPVHRILGMMAERKHAVGNPANSAETLLSGVKKGAVFSYGLLHRKLCQSGKIHGLVRRRRRTRPFGPPGKWHQTGFAVNAETTNSGAIRTERRTIGGVAGL